MTTFEIFGSLGLVIAALFGIIKVQHNQKKKLKDKVDAAQTQAKINETALNETAKANIKREVEKNEIENAKNASDVVNRVIDWLRKTNTKNSDSNK